MATSLTLTALHVAILFILWLLFAAIYIGNAFVVAVWWMIKNIWRRIQEWISR